MVEVLFRSRLKTTTLYFRVFFGKKNFLNQDLSKTLASLFPSDKLTLDKMMRILGCGGLGIARPRLIQTVSVGDLPEIFQS